MAAFDVRIEEGGLGVKLSPEPLSSQVFGLRVIGVNDPVRASRALIEVGDVLLAINGTRFTDPKEFLQWLRMPPYLLTVLRKEEGTGIPEKLEECGGSSSSSSGVEKLTEKAIQLKLPEGWKVGQATGCNNNCLVDSLLQLLHPDMEEAAREEQAGICRTALVGESRCKPHEFLGAAHIPRLLSLLGVPPEEITVFIVGFAELEKKIAPERIGYGTRQLLVLANVSRHMHFAPVHIHADARIEEGLQVVGALQDVNERAGALDGLFADLLGYSRGG